jgi:hypothetical protein
VLGACAAAWRVGMSRSLAARSRGWSWARGGTLTILSGEDGSRAPGLRSPGWRLAWPDGSTLEDDAESGVALFLGDRVPTGPARIEFYNSAGVLIASHATLNDERGPIRLPNFASATIPSETLVRFALSADHPLGRRKARRFETELGVTDRDWARLHDQILQALPQAIVRSITYSMPMGCAYEVVIPIAGVNGAIVSVLTIWTVLEGDPIPRLRSASIESP